MPRLSSDAEIGATAAASAAPPRRYTQVSKIIQPMREALALAEKEMAKAKALLKVKRGELKVILDEVAELQAQLDGALAKKAALKAEVDECQQRLSRAKRLINGLGGEKKQWKLQSQRLAKTLSSMVGDVVVASGFVAYLGPFPSSYRIQAVETWSAKLAELDIAASADFDIASVLGDPVRACDGSMATEPAPLAGGPLGTPRGMQ